MGWILVVVVLAGIASPASAQTEGKGTLTVDGVAVELAHISTRADELLGKRYATVILTEAPVPTPAVQKDTLYQLAYQKEIQGIRMRFDEDRKLVGIILYHSTINGPSVEYQGFAEFAYRPGSPSAIGGTVKMDYTDTGGRVIKIDAVFSTTLPK
ncbi:MAG: hypothetical protein ACRD2N_12330 [Vicinamibacterales bacterium]